MLPLGDQCEQVLPADRNINSMIPEQHKGLSEAKGRGQIVVDPRFADPLSSSLSVSLELRGSASYLRNVLASPGEDGT
ncbi:hypothetical protein NQZ68_008527 [Dissostichus eleginoides]|nr:hypothetical protein NQZ68_008527 [Dissostichus eleginoides]